MARGSSRDEETDEINQIEAIIHANYAGEESFGAYGDPTTSRSGRQRTVSWGPGGQATVISARGRPMPRASARYNANRFSSYGDEDFGAAAEDEADDMELEELESEIDSHLERYGETLSEYETLAAEKGVDADALAASLSPGLIVLPAWLEDGTVEGFQAWVTSWGSETKEIAVNILKDPRTDNWQSLVFAERVDVVRDAVYLAAFPGVTPQVVDAIWQYLQDNKMGFMKALKDVLMAGGADLQRVARSMLTFVPVSLSGVQPNLEGAINLTAMMYIGLDVPANDAIVTELTRHVEEAFAMRHQAMDGSIEVDLEPTSLLPSDPTGLALVEEMQYVEVIGTKVGSPPKDEKPGFFQSPAKVLALGYAVTIAGALAGLK